MQPERLHEKYERVVAAARELPPVKTVIVHPCDDVSLQSVIEATRINLIDPILVAPADKLRAVAAKAGIDIAALPLVDAAHSHDAAARAVALVREGKAEALMKGSLHTDELMGAVVARETGIRKAKRISHCFIMDVPGHPEPIIITDAAVDILTTLV